MSISVKFFARLREDIGRPVCDLSADEVSTALDAWHLATQGRDMPAGTLIAVNMEYANQDHTINDGDEVAFFPPVTGG